MTRNVIVSVPTFLTGIDLVRQSDLLISVPRRLSLKFHGLLVTRALPIPSPSFDVTLVWHTRTDGSRPHTWFRALIKKLAAAANPQRLISKVSR
jgi:DNA-binding transcriptional LysR family regulator